MSAISQQTVACGVLVKIKRYIDNEAIIAGGAPRDWLFGNEARDIDLYLRSFCNTNNRRMSQLEHCLGINIEVEKNESHELSDYGGLNIPIEGIVTFTYQGVKFQMIYISPNIDNFSEQVISHMDTGINRVGYSPWYERLSGSDFIKTQEYLDDIKNRTLTLYSSCMEPNQLAHCMKNHLPKMIKYFPDYKLTTK